MPGMIKSKEEKQLAQVLDTLEDWNFDVFQVSTLTSGKPLFFLGMALFKKVRALSVCLALPDYLLRLCF